MTVVFLGNRRAFNDRGVVETEDGKTVAVPPEERETLDGKRRTEVHLPDEASFMDALRTITDPRGVWAAHSPDPAPAWVSSSHPLLAEVLGQHYRCEVRPFLPQGERGEFASSWTSEGAPA